MDAGAAAASTEPAADGDYNNSEPRSKGGYLLASSGKPASIARCCAISDSIPLRASAIICGELRIIERTMLGGGLHFYELFAAGDDHVHVDVGAGVFFVAEVEHGCAIHDADAGGGDVVANRGRLERAGSQPWLSCARPMATNAPVMDAVRVPPSAWMTSQSMKTVRSPSFPCRSRRAGSVRSGAESRGCVRLPGPW